MTSWRFLLGTTLLACLAAGCSKTQDTAPETRAFGNPPVFQSADVVPGSSGFATCDFTDAANFWLVVNSLNVSLSGPIKVGVAFDELRFTAAVTDPDTKPGGTSDILLVSASYIDPSTVVLGSNGTPEEKTLILFDDGSQILFDLKQGADFPEDCTTTPGECIPAINKLKSGDVTARDNVYMRNIALVPLKTANLNGSALARDCVAQKLGEAPQDEPPGSSLSFRFDAVDRAGNLTTYSKRITPPPVGSSNFICSGDDCFCCYILIGTVGVVPGGACRGLAGMQGPDFPDGYCNSLAPLL